MITLGTAKITKEARDNVLECLDKNEIGQGKFIKEFEDKVAKYVGTKYAIATCNGSMADIVALGAIKERYFKTEVIVPALTFVAQVNAIIANGLTPIFVDVDENFQIDVEQVEKAINFGTLAIMPVHLLGKKCDIAGIKKIAGSMPILEDCCEAFGVKPRQIGTYSFFPSHTITTGEGGMIITDDSKLAERCRRIRNHGRKSEDILDKFHFDIFGFNGKMSNLNAAVGSGIIGEADKIIEKRKENVAFMNKKLDRNWEAQSPHCYPYMCENEEERDKKIIDLYKNGVEARKLFSCLPTQEKVYIDKFKAYRNTPFETGVGDFPNAEDVGKRGMYVPCHQELKEKDLIKICQIIKK